MIQIYPEVKASIENSEDPTKTKSQLNEEENEEEEEKLDANESKKSFYLFIVAAVGLLGGYLTMQMNTMRDEKSTKKVKVSYSGKASIGGPWKLLDTNGNEFSEKNLKGYNYLIYFGFCNCPDICPNSLLKLTKATQHIKEMSEGKYIRLKTVFVSVDPDRDTPEKINKFLALFDKNIIGVTGTSNNDPNLKQAMNTFRIYTSKIELDAIEKGGKKPYTLDHTIITYLMDDNNNYITHLGSNLGDRDLATLIVDSIQNNEKERYANKY